MLLSNYVEVGLNPKTISYYENKGYNIPRVFNKKNKLVVDFETKIVVNVKDLPNKSNVRVNIKCDGDQCDNRYLQVMWQDYKKCAKENGKYYCSKCANKLYGRENIRLSHLKEGKNSFEQWCIENNRQDVLDRWDYELNKYKPNEVNYSTRKQFYIKCPKGIHKSGLKNIHDFTKGQEGSLSCKQCNSFAQWGIDNLGEDFLEKYWDYQKNTADPWSINFSSHTKVYIRCQEKDYHGNYDIICNNFVNGGRCSYCSSKKVHPLDSLGKILEDKKLLELWSSKNKKSPYEYKPFSRTEVWWKCHNRKHKDYIRKITLSNQCDFRCPFCNFSLGEAKIEKYLLFHKIPYIPQKEFNNLVGINNGNLSYDFYLPDYNLLIEYQGGQHERYIKGFHQSKKDFKRQQEHDKRKKEYALSNGYNFLEIWYWDFDRIEEILSQIIN